MSRLQRDHLVDREDAVIVIRQPDGKVNLKQSISLAEMSRFRGRVLRSSLSAQQEARLQAALSGGAGGTVGNGSPATTGGATVGG